MTSFFKSNNMWLIAAATLSLTTTGLHVIGGTPEIMAPLNNSDAPALSKGIAEVMWNQITLLLLIGTWVFWRAASRPNIAADLLQTIIVLYVGITFLFIASGISLFGSIWVMPQWTLFLVMAGLAVLGILRPKKATSI